ncbi:unnamed protein product, partial [Brassica rapa subsp. trilocularis]
CDLLKDNVSTEKLIKIQIPATLRKRQGEHYAEGFFATIRYNCEASSFT